VRFPARTFCHPTPPLSSPFFRDSGSGSRDSAAPDPRPRAPLLSVSASLRLPWFPPASPRGACRVARRFLSADRTTRIGHLRGGAVGALLAPSAVRTFRAAVRSGIMPRFVVCLDPPKRSAPCRPPRPLVTLSLCHLVTLSPRLFPRPSCGYGGRILRACTVAPRRRAGLSFPGMQSSALLPARVAPASRRWFAPLRLSVSSGANPCRISST